MHDRIYKLHISCIQLHWICLEFLYKEIKKKKVGGGN